MDIAVTGATGNIGSAVVRRLVREGHRVTGVVRRPPQPNTGTPFDAVDWVRADLSADCATALANAFRGSDAVVHLVWGFQPSHDVAYLEALGVGGTRQVLRAARYAGVGHVVHLSSVGAYAPRRGAAPVDESWPTSGIASSSYSRHKAAAERLLDEVERDGPDPVVTRIRPGIVGQRDAGSSMLRYFLPGLLPAAALRLLPVLPLDRRLEIPVVHADDVADAIVRVLTSRAPGAFNLAADPPVTAETLAAALGARHVQLPARVLRVAASASWHARLQPVDPGWVDLAYQVPLLDTTRAERELGWAPTKDALTTLEETVDGMQSTASAPTPSLRLRTVGDALARAVTGRPVGRRRRP